MINYYDLLGVKPDAAPDEIRAAYLFQIKVFHPDRYDPDRQPSAHVRAAFMTERLNQARATLTDPDLRRAYDAQLHPPASPPPAPPPPPPPPPAKASSPQRRRWPGRVGLLILAACGLWLWHPHRSPRPTALARPPVSCPAGAPIAVVTSVAIYPNPEDPGFGRPTRLYIVHGLITNRTDAEVNVNHVGFYLGDKSMDLAPTWDDDTANMETSGDPTRIAAHTQVSFVERHAVELPEGQAEPFPATINVSLRYPASALSRPEAQWWWSEAPVGCPVSAAE